MTESVAHSSRLDPIEDAVSAIAAGRPILVVDDEDRENEGDLIMAAEFAMPRRWASSSGTPRASSAPR